MKAAHETLGIITLAINLAAGVWGAWCWYRWTPSAAFWLLLRAGQALLLLCAADGAILLLTGHKIPGTLHYVYGLVPLVVSFMAEQLKIGAAEAVLHGRGFDSAQEVGALPGEEQNAIVLQIVRRELGVMTLSALVCAALVARAAGAHGNV
jgi:hypothetical protein